LSEWLLIYRGETAIDAETIHTAEVAISQLGTNALPYVLDRMRYEAPHSGIKPALRSLFTVVPRVLKPERFNRWLYTDPAVERADVATGVFLILGDRAKAAVPELTKRMADAASPAGSARATYALACICKGSMADLLAMLANTNTPNRQVVIGFLPTSSTNADEVVPVLVACLEDRDRVVRITAATVLGRFGEHARGAVPLLLQMAADPDPVVRLVATNALKKIAPGALTNAPPAPGQLTVPTPGTGAHE
jgi:hypothetical protein